MKARGGRRQEDGVGTDGEQEARDRSGLLLAFQPSLPEHLRQDCWMAFHAERCPGDAIPLGGQERCVFRRHELAQHRCPRSELFLPQVVISQA
jgi:hypothetical protein